MPPAKSPENKRGEEQAAKPPRTLLSATGRAIGDFSMIREGDRVLLGLSGGKD
ncbi:MAG: hypothetical protein WC029_09820 [Sulfuricella sp.]